MNTSARLSSVAISNATPVAVEPASNTARIDPATVPKTGGWIDSRVSLLKQLWTDGLTASKIAAQLGGVTRNAVIGKAHRLGLSPRTRTASSFASANTRTRAPRVARPRIMKPKTAKYFSAEGKSEALPVTASTFRHRDYGPSTHLSDREKRERGFAYQQLGSHMPPPGDGLSASDLRYMEKYLYRNV